MKRIQTLIQPGIDHTNSEGQIHFPNPPQTPLLTPCPSCPTGSSPRTPQRERPRNHNHSYNLTLQKQTARERSELCTGSQVLIPPPPFCHTGSSPRKTRPREGKDRSLPAEIQSHRDQGSSRARDTALMLPLESSPLQTLRLQLGSCVEEMRKQMRPNTRSVVKHFGVKLPVQHTSRRLA